MSARIISCLLCGEDFAREALKDHIACGHLDYVPHRCHECGLCCVNSEEMFHHAVMTGHHTVLKERDKNNYAEFAVELVYRDCVNACEVGLTETQGMLPLPVETSRHAPPSLQVPRDLASSANPIVKQQEVLASPFATTTGEMLPPRVATSQRPVDNQKKASPNQCQLCQKIVERKRRKKHVRKKHLRLTATCPVSGCGYEVTSDFETVAGHLGKHVQARHGFNTLTRGERATYKKAKEERRRADNDFMRDCFPFDGR